MTIGTPAAKAALNGTMSRASSTGSGGTVATGLVWLSTAEPCPGQCLTAVRTPARRMPASQAATADATRAGSAENDRCRRVDEGARHVEVGVRREVQRYAEGEHPRGRSRTRSTRSGCPARCP